MDRLELARLLGARGPAAATPAKPAVIMEAEPVRFIAALAAAVAGAGPVFLADPDWDVAAKAQLEEISLMRPTSKTEAGWLCIPSGGTSGALKFARHDEQTIQAAVQGFCAHFGVSRVNAVGLLPLHHVSGLMAWMRCALTGGRYEPWSWKELEAGRRPVVTGDDWFLSLVPTQLQRLLASPDAVAWLRKFRVIFVGGGPTWEELADAAAAAALPVSLSYGMTETAAMVAALRPSEFLAGARDCGRPLPHAQITITAQGAVRVAGESVFRGYWPGWQEERELVTADLGRLDEQGHIHLLGRSDAMIITGGKKVAPAEVEAALRATGEFDDVAVIGVPDAEWGEAVVACYPADGRAPDLGRVGAALGLSLAAPFRPKRYVAIAAWPRNAQGKLNRAALLAQLRPA